MKTDGQTTRPTRREHGLPFPAGRGLEETVAHAISHDLGAALRAVDDVVELLEAVLGGRYTLCVEHDVFYALRQLRRRGFHAVLLDADLPRLERVAKEFAVARGNHEVIVLDRRSGAARIEEVA